VRSCVLALCMLLLSGAVHAEPDASTKYIMNEPLSLLEWGLYRLEKAYDKQTWSDLDIRSQYTTARYDWSKNTIYFEIVVYPSFESLQKTPAQKVCGSVVHQIKSLFGVESGYEFMRDYCGIGTYFHPQYWENKNSPKTLDSDIEKITNIQVKVMASKNDQAPFKEAASCSSELLQPEIKYFTTTSEGH